MKVKKYRYGNFIVSEENVMKKKLNFREIGNDYFGWFVAFMNAGQQKNKSYYIEKGFKILIELEKSNPHHKDIIKIYRFIKEENNGTHNKIKQEINRSILEGKTWHSNEYLPTYN